jgi:hypothetical protein
VRRVRRRDGDGDGGKQDRHEAAGRRHGSGRHFQLLLAAIHSQVAKQFVPLFHVFSLCQQCATEESICLTRKPRIGWSGPNLSG